MSRSNSFQSINNLPSQEVRNPEGLLKKQVSVLIKNQNKVLKSQINTKHFKLIQLRRNNLSSNKTCKLYQHFPTLLLRKSQNRDNLQPKAQNSFQKTMLEKQMLKFLKHQMISDFANNNKDQTNFCFKLTLILTTKLFELEFTKVTTLIKQQRSLVKCSALN